MSKFFRNLLLVEVAVIVVATVVFSVVSERIVAGAIAGTVFVALGLGIMVWGFRGGRGFRTLTFWAGCLHLFGSALPLMVTRFLNSAAVFEDVNVLGLSGPVFHRVSSTVYLILMVATIVDWVRFARQAKRA